MAPAVSFHDCCSPGVRRRLACPCGALTALSVLVRLLFAMLLLMTVGLFGLLGCSLLARLVYAELLPALSVATTNTAGVPGRGVAFIVFFGAILVVETTTYVIATLTVAISNVALVSWFRAWWPRLFTVASGAGEDGPGSPAVDAGTVATPSPLPSPGADAPSPTAPADAGEQRRRRWRQRLLGLQTVKVFSMAADRAEQCVGLLLAFFVLCALIIAAVWPFHDGCTAANAELCDGMYTPAQVAAAVESLAAAGGASSSLAGFSDYGTRAVETVIFVSNIGMLVLAAALLLGRAAQALVRGLLGWWTIPRLAGLTPPRRAALIAAQLALAPVVLCLVPLTLLIMRTLTRLVAWAERGPAPAPTPAPAAAPAAAAPAAAAPATSPSPQQQFPAPSPGPAEAAMHAAYAALMRWFVALPLFDFADATSEEMGHRHASSSTSAAAAAAGAPKSPSSVAPAAAAAAAAPEAPPAVDTGSQAPPTLASRLWACLSHRGDAGAQALLLLSFGSGTSAWANFLYNLRHFNAWYALVWLGGAVVYYDGYASLVAGLAVVGVTGSVVCLRNCVHRIRKRGCWDAEPPAFSTSQDDEEAVLGPPPLATSLAAFAGGLASTPAPALAAAQPPAPEGVPLALHLRSLAYAKGAAAAQAPPAHARAAADEAQPAAATGDAADVVPVATNVAVSDGSGAAAEAPATAEGAGAMPQPAAAAPVASAVGAAPSAGSAPALPPHFPTLRALPSSADVGAAVEGALPESTGARKFGRHQTHTSSLAALRALAPADALAAGEGELSASCAWGAMLLGLCFIATLGGFAASPPLGGALTLMVLFLTGSFCLRRPHFGACSLLCRLLLVLVAAVYGFLTSTLIVVPPGADLPYYLAPLPSNESAPPFTWPPAPAYDVCQADIEGLSIVDACFMATTAYSPQGVEEADVADWFAAAGRTVVGFPLPNTTSGVSASAFVEVLSLNASTGAGPAPAGRAYVVIRGTATDRDVAQDGLLWQEAAILQLLGAVGPYGSWPVSVKRGFIGVIAFIERAFHVNAELSYATDTVAAVAALMAALPANFSTAVTGHSLGGGLATLVGQRLGLKSISFSGPGVQMSATKFGLPPQLELGLPLTVMPAHDLVPLIDTQVGAVQGVRCLGSDSPLDCHSIERTCCELRRACGDPYGRRLRVCPSFGYLSPPPELQ